MENYIFAGRARAGAIERRVDGDAERLCAAWDARHAVHRQVLEADHRADDKTMIPAPAIISARAAAFVCSSSVTPRAAAIHLGMKPRAAPTVSGDRAREGRLSGSAHAGLDLLV